MSSKNFSIDDVVFSIIYKSSCPIIYKNNAFLQRAFFDIQKHYDTILDDLIFDTSCIHPFSDELDSILFRLETSTLLITSLNWGHYVLNSKSHNHFNTIYQKIDITTKVLIDRCAKYLYFYSLKEKISLAKHAEYTDKRKFINIVDTKSPIGLFYTITYQTMIVEDRGALFTDEFVKEEDCFEWFRNMNNGILEARQITEKEYNDLLQNRNVAGQYYTISYMVADTRNEFGRFKYFDDEYDFLKYLNDIT